MAVALLSMQGQKALICAPKMNENLTGLERYEGEYLMTDLSFLGELIL